MSIIYPQHIAVDAFTPADDDPRQSRMDLMLVLTGGHERTLAEYQQLLESAGLELSRLIPTQSSWYVIEGKR